MLTDILMLTQQVPDLLSHHPDRGKVMGTELIVYLRPPRPRGTKFWDLGVRLGLQT